MLKILPEQLRLPPLDWLFHKPGFSLIKNTKKLSTDKDFRG